MQTTLRLKAGVGTTRNSEPDDVLTLKKALNKLGLYAPDPELGFNEFVDRELATAIRRFQKSRGLLESGEVRPGDDTERAIARDLSVAEDRRQEPNLPIPAAAKALGGRENGGAARRVEARPDLAADARKVRREASDSRLIGPGNVNTGEDAGADHAKERHNPIRDVGRPTDAPVDAAKMMEALGFDPKGPGRTVRALETPFAANIVYRDLANEAIRATARQFPGVRPFNNAADAFRHALWNYRITKMFGPDMAKPLTDAHEISSPGPVGDRLMDLFNNNVGRRLALDPRNKDRDDEEVILEALHNEQLQTRPFQIKREP